MVVLIYVHISLSPNSCCLCRPQLHTRCRTCKLIIRQKPSVLLETCDDGKISEIQFAFRGLLFKHVHNSYAQLWEAIQPTVCICLLHPFIGSELNKLQKFNCDEPHCRRTYGRQGLQVNKTFVHLVLIHHLCVTYGVERVCHYCSE